MHNRRPSWKINNNTYDWRSARSPHVIRPQGPICSCDCLQDDRQGTLHFHFLYLICLIHRSQKSIRVNLMRDLNWSMGESAPLTSKMCSSRTNQGEESLPQKARNRNRIVDDFPELPLSFGALLGQWKLEKLLRWSDSRDAERALRWGSHEDSWTRKNDYIQIGLITRMLQASEGSIRLNGETIEKYNVRKLRKVGGKWNASSSTFAHLFDER